MTFDEINQELRALADYNRDLANMAVYEELLQTMFQDEMIAHYALLELATNSYECCNEHGIPQ